MRAGVSATSFHPLNFFLVFSLHLLVATSSRTLAVRLTCLESAKRPSEICQFKGEEIHQRVNTWLQT